LGSLAWQVRIVAFADADFRRCEKGAFKKYPDVPRYDDYRRMLDRHGKEIDAVVVSTPDHTHACIAWAAMEMGKHVYCEKPLAHSVWEVRQLMEVARRKKVITQLGNQGHSSNTIRMFCEWIWAGAIGTVHTIHAWCQKVHSAIPKLGLRSETHPIPEGLNWDVWLGPAQERPYHPMYLPGAWRNWYPFGSGTIGDWVCHVVDPVAWALDLGAPRTVKAVEVDRFDPVQHADTFPFGSHIVFQIPSRRQRNEITLHWYDGTIKPPRPPELEPGRELPGIGAVVVGDRGSIVYGSHGAASPRIIPEAKMKEFRPPEPTIPRVKGHHEDWIQAIRENRPAGSNFDYGGPLTEIALLGIVAQRFPGTELVWNSNHMQFENHAAATALLRPQNPRPGWFPTT
jgi:predicted dehydrogenase